jgi:hypothetical protein
VNNQRGTAILEQDRRVIIHRLVYPPSQSPAPPNQHLRLTHERRFNVLLGRHAAGGRMPEVELGTDGQRRRRSAIADGQLYVAGSAEFYTLPRSD